MTWQRISTPTIEIYSLDLGNKLVCEVCKRPEESFWRAKVFREFSVEKHSLADAQLYCKTRALEILQSTIDMVKAV